jgi:hypothetical protein
LIATFGIVSIVAMSAGSAVLLSRVSSNVALAALALGFAAIVLVAIGGRGQRLPRTRIQVSERKGSGKSPEY